MSGLGLGGLSNCDLLQGKPRWYRLEYMAPGYRRSLAGVFVAVLAVGPDMTSAKPLVPTHSASHKLEFSGATVAVRESYGQTHWPIAARTLILTGPNGHTQKLRLHQGGGTARNSSLNLFAAADGRYFLVSERDCVEFDPIRVHATYCKVRPPCDGGAVHGPIYLGRFDWMNGYDPPKGAFGLAFRFLPFQDAVESESCPARPKT
jgi:hypothetical protein